jgi:LysM repeat protein
MDNAANVTIKAPAALTGVVTVQVAMTTPAVDADFGNYNDGVSDITIAAGKTIKIPNPSCTDLRLISAGAEGAQRDFVVSVQEDMAG